MESARRQEIIKLACEITDRYNPSELTPFPFSEITKVESQLQIREVDNLPSNVSGGIGLIKGTDHFLILINNSKHQNRRYFTVAHELGHFFLHRETISKSKQNIFIDEESELDSSQMLFRFDGQSDEIEREANIFAAEMIMPEKLVKKVWAELKDIREVAKVLSVSIAAMSIRLAQLGLLENG